MIGGLVERATELDVVTGLLARSREGAGGMLVVEGVAGLGKTSLVQAAAALAREHGDEVLTATGHPLESSLSFGLVRQLLERRLAEAPPAERDRLVTGPGRGAVPLLEGASSSGQDELEIVHAAYRLVAQLAESRPTVLVVDDLQWGDRSSLTFLLYLSQRLADLPLAVLATVRAGETAAAGLLARLRGEATAGVHALAPLSEAACRALVLRRFPEATDAFCAEAARLTAGNPFLLHELLETVAAGGGATDEPAARRLDETASVSLQSSTALRLSLAGQACPAVAEALAVLETGAPLRRVAGLAGLELETVAEAADALVRAGLLETSEPPAFAHPLIRSAVHTAIPEAERALRHRRAAALARADGAGSELVAAHLLQATRAGDESAVEALRSAARDALSRGAADSACRYLERALEEPPAAVLRAPVLTELAEAELRAGRPRAFERLAEAQVAAPDPATEVAVLVRLGDVLFQSGRYVDAADAFDRAERRQGGHDEELRSRLRACRLAMETLRPGGRVEPDLVAPGEPEIGGGRFLRVHLGLASVMGIGSYEHTRRLATGALGDGAMLAEQGIGLDYLVAMGCLIWSDSFEECDREITRALAATAQEAAHLAGAHLRFGRAWMRYWQGRLEEAAADSMAAIEPWRGGWNGQIHFARFWCASALVELGRLDEAQAVLDQPDAEEPGADAVATATTEVARGRLATARGDHQGAWQHHRRAAEAAGSLPFLGNPTVLNWRSDGALAALAVGDDAAAELAAAELSLARAYGAPRPIGVALRAMGLVAGGDEGITLLRESVDVLASSPAALEEARARLDLGGALRRAGRRAEAREVLLGALDRASRMGAARLTDRARAELAAAGGRPRREAVSGPAALTPSERRVCELAVAGRSNPDIAAELFLSRRTVEFHLRGAFRKLAIGSRDELAAALQADA